MSTKIPVQKPLRRPFGDGGLALLGLIWWGACREIADRAATGLLGSIAAGVFVPLLGAAFLLFLVVLGLLALDMLRHERRSVRNLLGLPRRVTAPREWGLGAAFGWGVVVAAVLPLTLTRGLYLQSSFTSANILAAVVSIVTLGLSTLAVEAIFRRYAFQRLASAVGPNFATILLCTIYAAATALLLANAMAFLVSFLLALLLTVAWRRTHALWLPWGLHFAWSVSLGLLFGLPLFSGTELANIFQAQAHGSRLLAAGGFGPIASPWTAVVLLVALALLIWHTRDYAWEYTHTPIIAAGYPMEVAPPSAHAAMQQPAPPPPLVQIAPVTSPGVPPSDSLK